MNHKKVRPELFYWRANSSQSASQTASQNGPLPAPEKAQQRPKEFEESHYKFPDALELIPVRDTHERLEDHIDWGHCTIRGDADRNGGRQCKRNSGSRFMTRMIAVANPRPQITPSYAALPPSGSSSSVSASSRRLKIRFVAPRACNANSSSDRPVT